MDPASILAEATSILGLANLAIQTANDAAPYFEAAVGVLQGTALTDQQRADLVAREAAMRAQLDAQSIPADAP